MKLSSAQQKVLSVMKEHIDHYRQCSTYEELITEKKSKAKR